MRVATGEVALMGLSCPPCRQPSPAPLPSRKRRGTGAAVPKEGKQGMGARKRARGRGTVEGNRGQESKRTPRLIVSVLDTR